MSASAKRQALGRSASPTPSGRPARRARSPRVAAARSLSRTRRAGRENRRSRSARRGRAAAAASPRDTAGCRSPSPSRDRAQHLLVVDGGQVRDRRIGRRQAPVRWLGVRAGPCRTPASARCAVAPRVGSARAGIATAGSAGAPSAAASSAAGSSQAGPPQGPARADRAGRLGQSSLNAHPPVSTIPSMVANGPAYRLCQPQFSSVTPQVDCVTSPRRLDTPLHPRDVAVEIRAPGARAKQGW